jgi:hypothetical protein
MLDLRRREFITLLGGAAAWPFAANAQPHKIARTGLVRARRVLQTNSGDSDGAPGRFGHLPPILSHPRIPIVPYGVLTL